MDTILITGAGCPGWYSVYSVLKKHYIIACDIMPYTIGTELANEYYTVPKGNDVNYIESIFDIVKKSHINIIIPLTDPELIPLSENIEKLNCNILISNSTSLKKVLDKQMLYETLQTISPSFKLCKTIEDFNEFLKLNELCYVKLITNYGSRGTKEIVYSDYWFRAFERCKPEEFGKIFPINQIRTLFDYYNLLAIEYLPGAEYSIDCIYDNIGDLKFYGVREREEVKNGICQTARFIIDDDQEFLEFIQEINIPFKYNINIQAKRNSKGQLKLLEINPRISGSIGSFLPAGYDLIRMGLNLLMNGNIMEELTPKQYLKHRTHRVSYFPEVK